MRDCTDITILLDTSSSMWPKRDVTIKGFNEFLQAQRLEPGECRINLAYFDTKWEFKTLGQAVADVPDLTFDGYSPRGISTALIDSSCQAIDSIGAHYARMPEKDRPSKVIFATISDGEENASRYFTAEHLKERIARQQNTYSWQFVYIGSNQDAVTSGTRFGYQAQNTMNYADVNPDDAMSMYKGFAKSISKARSSTGEQFTSMSFTSAAIDGDAKLCAMNAHVQPDSVMKVPTNDEHAT